jgi:hypothetical protein
MRQLISSLVVPCLVFVLFAGPAGASAQAPAPASQAGLTAPTADTRARGQALIKDAVAAMGGADRLAAIKDVTVKGKVVLNGPMGEVSGESVAYVLYPDKIKSTITLPMGPMVQGYDGKVAWVQMGGQSQELPASMNEEMERNILTSGAIGIMRVALSGEAEVDAAGEASVNGRRADVVQWRRGTQEMQIFLDARTHLVSKLAFRATTPQGDLDFEVIVSDHRDVNGVRIPWKAVGTQGGQPYLQLTVTSIQVNAGLDPALFAKP